MDSVMRVTVNGQAKELEGMGSPSALSRVLEELGLRADRIAVELNGEIAPRGTWEGLTVVEGDRIEVVHFVGGGWGGESDGLSDV
ncbi:MAG TPA: sulfur carrier protein ThiS [Acidobacteriaceae bacterium]|nr:sulfur carrier protein ThiS [Acidobacteriaceae bacterium]